MVYILLGAGFEEAEALVTADVLRRGNVSVTLTGIGGSHVTGAHGIAVLADLDVDAVRLKDGDMVVLPGGMGGVSSIGSSPAAMALVRQAADDPTLWLAAICAAPTLLAQAGVIGSGRHAVCYPGMEEILRGAGVTPHMDQAVVKDGRLITGKGPGTVFNFGLALLEVLTSSAAAHQVQADLHYAL